jgi:hypothetical protein
MIVLDINANYTTFVVIGIGSKHDSLSKLLGLVGEEYAGSDYLSDLSFKDTILLLILCILDLVEKKYGDFTLKELDFSELNFFIPKVNHQKTRKLFKGFFKDLMKFYSIILES